MSTDNWLSIVSASRNQRRAAIDIGLENLVGGRLDGFFRETSCETLHKAVLRMEAEYWKAIEEIEESR